MVDKGLVELKVSNERLRLEDLKKSKNLQARRFRNRAISNCKKTVASTRMTLGLIWQSCHRELVGVIQHGGIPCIQFLIARETHVDGTEFARQSDAVLKELGNADFWHLF